jgi:EAL domain-containing protein (putative c-di-GMP-specific phosphodiesterase class I)
MQRRLDDEQELRSAIASGEIVAWYQPQVDLKTGRIVGAEALARWAHPTRGLLDAFHFVPLAEEAGFVRAVDGCIVQSAVQTRAVLAPDAVDDSFRIWCNVSAEQFTRTHPTERFARLLERVGCDPNAIGIEITESAVLADTDAAAHEVAAARALGIKVALDDFGTGQSSLTLLRSLPIDAVKIDRTFVRGITREPRDAAIVGRLVALAHDLGLAVVAEGVETPEQARLLREIGCCYGQGYLWARAVPVDELLRQVRAQDYLTAPRA